MTLSRDEKWDLNPGSCHTEGVMDEMDQKKTAEVSSTSRALRKSVMLTLNINLTRPGVMQETSLGTPVRVMLIGSFKVGRLP